MDSQVQPKYIEGYWRGRQEAKPTNEQGYIIAGILLVAVAAMVAIMLWQVTLTLLFSAAVTYAARRAYQRRQERLLNGLRVNYMATKVRFI